MKEVIFLAVATSICIAILGIFADQPTENESIIIKPEETFILSYNNLHKGKEIIWGWEVEKDLPAPKPDIIFWIEDSIGHKHFETVSSKDEGSFKVPFTDKWTLKWENPNHLEETEGFALKFTHKVEIVNQPPIASIKTDIKSKSPAFNVSFTGNGVDYDGMINSYHWDFGEGNSSNEQNPTHSFQDIGTYTVTLTVTDDDGSSEIDTMKITVNPLTN